MKTRPLILRKPLASASDALASSTTDELDPLSQLLFLLPTAVHGAKGGRCFNEGERPKPGDPNSGMNIGGVGTGTSLLRGG